MKELKEEREEMVDQHKAVLRELNREKQLLFEEVKDVQVQDFNPAVSGFQRRGSLSERDISSYVRVCLSAQAQKCHEPNRRDPGEARCRGS